MVGSTDRSDRRERLCVRSSGSSALNQPVKLAYTERFRRAYSEVLEEPHGDDDGP